MSFSRKSLVVCSAVAVVAGTLLVLSAASGGRSTEPERRGRELPAVERVGVRPFDLPSGFRYCPYSGDYDAYLRNLRGMNTGTDQAAADTWTSLKQAGAVAGFVAFYGDGPSACDDLLEFADERGTDAEKATITEHPRFVYSVVIQFADEAAAVAAYERDLLRQSELKSGKAMNIEEGATTGLGPNSLVVTNEGSSLQVRRVAWQSEKFAVLVSTTDMDLPASESITTAMNLRMAS